MDGMVTGEGATLGTLLRTIRLDRGMTQEQLGDATGLSVRSIRDLERGVSCPRVSTLRLLTQTWNLPEAQAAELHRLARSRRDRSRRRQRRGGSD
ncbi:helix-turn-helix domain-containing protein [Kitasatospora xanthocidica]|uniref:helix-turn-helix domain-containing protein n=1 Tax=Kitasatospora xanthocidica TaxID=83382 RepID=UPI0036EF934F